MEKKLKIINAALIGAIAAVIFIFVITPAADIWLFIKDWLRTTFSHHWLGKSVLSGIIFIFVFLLLLLSTTKRKELNEKKIEKNIWLLFWLTLIGSMIIIAFRIYETFFK